MSSPIDTKAARAVLTPVVDCHAERIKIGDPTNRDRLSMWAIENLGALLDEVTSLRARLATHDEVLRCAREELASFKADAGALGSRLMYERDAAVRERDEYRRLAQLEDADVAIILELLEQAPPPTQALRELMARSAPDIIDGTRGRAAIERDTAEEIAAWLEDGDGALEQVIARDIRAGKWKEQSK
jgi:hypothetical protein